MKPLRVALFVKSSPIAAERENRNMGMWSYDVPEFTWKHFYSNNFSQVDRSRFGDFDLIFHEDAGYAAYVNSGPKVVYYTFDSFLDDAHRTVRLKQAHYADLILIDHDDINLFQGMKVLRFPYATNDRLYKPVEKTMDVAYHCQSGAKNGTPKAKERSELRAKLGEICGRRGWSFVSGALSHAEYAASMGRSKVVVNLSRNWLHRAHREIDAMACGACYLTDPHMETIEDGTTAGVHYATFEDDIESVLERLLDGGEWQRYAKAGYEAVTKLHTWQTRAGQLREIVNAEFGI